MTIIEELEKEQIKAEAPKFNVGDTVRVHGKIKEGILYQKGIQDQICDILEGGKQAFEKRRNRYWGTKQQE